MAEEPGNLKRTYYSFFTFKNIKYSKGDYIRCIKDPVDDDTENNSDHDQYKFIIGQILECYTTHHIPYIRIRLFLFPPHDHIGNHFNHELLLTTLYEDMPLIMVARKVTVHDCTKKKIGEFSLQAVPFNVDAPPKDVYMFRHYFNSYNNTVQEHYYGPEEEEFRMIHFYKQHLSDHEAKKEEKRKKNKCILLEPPESGGFLFLGPPEHRKGRTYYQSFFYENAYYHINDDVLLTGEGSDNEWIARIIEIYSKSPRNGHFIMIQWYYLYKDLSPEASKKLETMITTHHLEPPVPDELFISNHVNENEVEQTLLSRKQLVFTPRLYYDTSNTTFHLLKKPWETNVTTLFPPSYLHGSEPHSQIN